MQGEIWLHEAPKQKARPMLVLTRPAAAEVVARVVVAPITSTIRGLRSELPVGPEHGLDHDSVASFDNIRTVRKSALTVLLGTLGPDGNHRICAALGALADCS